MFDWNSLFQAYVEDVPLKLLSREHTKSLESPSFGSLRNFACKHRWKERRAEIWRERRESQEKGDGKLHEGLTSLPPSDSVDPPLNSIGLVCESPDFDSFTQQHGRGWRRV